MTLNNNVRLFMFTLVHFSYISIAPVIAVNTGDDDIVAGPQKMSLKCPVRQTCLQGLLYRVLICLAAELYACVHSLSLFKMCPCAVLRCHILVFYDGTNYDLALPSLRKNIGLQRPHN